MKRETLVLGLDDGPFEFKKGDALVVGTVFRGGDLMDGLLSTKVKVDGVDATSKLIRMINKSKWKSHLQYIILDGITLGGFNVVDVSLLHRKTYIPIVIVIRKKPDIDNIKAVLAKIGKLDSIKAIDMAGKVLRQGKVYFQYFGCTEAEARELLDLTVKRGNIPEPIRLAHIIASGLEKGESKGRA